MLFGQTFQNISTLFTNVWTCIGDNHEWLSPIHGLIFFCETNEYNILGIPWFRFSIKWWMNWFKLGGSRVKIQGCYHFTKHTVALTQKFSHHYNKEAEGYYDLISALVFWICLQEILSGSNIHLDSGMNWSEFC